jgi:8-oxo-dGTP pyrophosphatase MutT (NUDIX family)
MPRIDYYHDPNAPAPDTKAVTVCVAVSDENGRLLMIERSDNGNMALPSGGWELGETLPQAAARECREETGYDIEISDLIGTFSDPGVIADYQTATPEVRQECSVMFAGRVVSGQATPSSESPVVQWLNPDELEGVPMAEAMRYRVRVWASHNWPHLG